MSEETSLEQQIADAMAAGDWEKSRALKHQRLDREHGRAAPEPADPATFNAAEQITVSERIDALSSQIMEATAAGDWEKSRALKHQLTDIRIRESREKASGGWR